jgi:hypothetical protein
MRRAIRTLLLVLGALAVPISSVHGATDETSTIETEGTVAAPALENAPESADVQTPAARLPMVAISGIAIVAILVVTALVLFSRRGRKRR